MKEVISDLKNENVSQVIALLDKNATFLKFMRPNMLLH